MSPRVLVGGIGNIFLGDDGFGPEVLRRVHGTTMPEGIRAVDYGIRGLHLAYDLLDGWDALVLVDAIPNRGQPGTISVLEVGSGDVGDAEFDAHGMDPAAVLASLKSLGGRLPRTLLVGCQVADVGERIGLSEAVQAAVDEASETAVRLAQELLDEAELQGDSKAREYASRGWVG